MKKHFLNSMAAVAMGTAIGVALSLAPITVTGQAPAQGGGAPAGGPPAQGGGGGRGGGGRGGGAPAAPAGPIVRGPDGKPDLNGYWGARGSLANITGAMVEPADKKIPYQPGWADRAALNNNRLPNNTAYLEPELHCFQSGVPSFMWRQFGPMQWIHTPTHLVMMHEFMAATRTIPLDNRPHIPENIKLFMGDGVGHWEGDTLVVETTNNTDRTWFDNDGNIHSDQLKVVERFTPTDANTMTYEATITDPKAFTAPWKITGSVNRNNQADFQILEFACVEGNKDIEHYTETAGGKKKNIGISAPPGSEAPPAAGRGGGGGGGRGGAGGGPGGGRGGAPGGAPQQQ